MEKWSLLTRRSGLTSSLGGGACDVIWSCCLRRPLSWPPPLCLVAPLTLPHSPHSHLAPPSLISRRLGPRLGAGQGECWAPCPPTQDTRTSLIAGFRSLASSSAFPVNHAAARPSPCLIIASHFNGNCFHPRQAAAQFLRRPGRGLRGPLASLPQQPLIFSSPDRSAWKSQGCVCEGSSAWLWAESSAYLHPL